MSEAEQAYAMIGMIIGFIGGFAMRWAVSVSHFEHAEIVHRWRTAVDLLSQMTAHIQDYKDMNKTLHDERVKLLSELKRLKEESK